MAHKTNFLKRLAKTIPVFGKPDPLITAIELYGAIGVGGPGSKTITHAKVEKVIKEAFKPKNLAAVALLINSPGGSPVQSRLIQRSIRREAEKRSIPVYAFIEDVGASGGYLLAIAADEIYSDVSSIIGSIGVISAGFGFNHAIEKVGVERRVHTAGGSKSQLDPFKPENPEDITRLKAILEETHAQFIELVKDRRGERLGTQEDIFSGAFWTSDGAKLRGLIDGTTHFNDFVTQKFGEDAKVKKISSKKGPLSLLSVEHQTTGHSGPLDLNIESALDQIETRALWNRYGR